MVTRKYKMTERKSEVITMVETSNDNYEFLEGKLSPLIYDCIGNIRQKIETGGIIGGIVGWRD